MTNLKFLLCAFFLSVTGLTAAQITVRGVVLDEENQPVSGATVQLLSDTTRGVATDFDGNFSIRAEAGQKLLVSYIGYRDQEVIAAPTLRIVLIPDTQQLDEVIVVGYGTAFKAGYTGSVSTVKQETIANSQVSSVSRLLQGSASGIQSVAASGQPGSDAEIFIRGVGSVNASSRPLYIVDGAPFEGSLNAINPADIESVSVLKDAASTAIYGSRAANGLIVITTKQGTKNKKANITLTLKSGPSFRAVDDYKKVSTDQYWELYWEALRNQHLYVNGRTPAEAAAIASANIVQDLGINPYGSAYPNPVGTDGKIVQGATPLWDDGWTRLYTQHASRHEGQIGISGGGDASSYYISLGYLNDQGIAPASDFTRYTGRVNLNTDLREWLKINTNIFLTHSIQNAPTSQDSTLDNALNFARLLPNFYPVYEREADGAYVLDENGNRKYDYGDYRPSSALPRFNHLGSSQYDFNRVARDLASIRFGLEISLLEGLTYRGSVNVDYTNRNDHNYTNPAVGRASYGDVKGSVGRVNTRSVGFTANNIITYSRLWQDLHSFKVFAGQEYHEFNTSFISGTRSGFPSLGLTEPAAASQLGNFSGYSDQYKLLSFFGNAEYNYNRKYYGSASVRTDGSSRFSPESRWGVFWALGASWRISEENFLKDSKALSSLTLRASYGGQGNDGLGGYYPYQELFALYNNLGESGFLTSSLGNRNLKWETNLNANIGVDFGFFDNRISGAVEFFSRRSSDLLFDVPTPSSIGYGSYPANVGALTNKGIEISVNVTPVKTNRTEWSVFANATHFKNTITKLPQDEIISGNKLMRVGGSIYDFFLVEWAGIDTASGLPQWFKTNAAGEREKTFVYNEANNPQSKIITGTSLPSLSGGFGTNFKYGNFEVSALFAYSLGGKLYNGDKIAILHSGTSAGRAFSTEMRNRWTPENPNTDVPRLQTTTTNAWTNASTRFLIDADYLRLKNLTFAYNLPSEVSEKINLKSLKLFVQGENFFTWFKEEGIDPEQTIGGSTYFRYPAMRSLSFGVTVSL